VIRATKATKALLGLLDLRVPGDPMVLMGEVVLMGQLESKVPRASKDQLESMVPRGTMVRLVGPVTQGSLANLARRVLLGVVALLVLRVCSERWVHRAGTVRPDQKETWAPLGSRVDRVSKDPKDKMVMRVVKEPLAPLAPLARRGPPG
jgi:hypothetical protein